MDKFIGKVVVVTGGSNGIGAEISKSFAKDGAIVIMNYFSDTKNAEKMKEEIEINGGKVILKKGSVNDSEFVKEMFDEVSGEFGKIDYLINNAGITKDGFLMMSNLKDVQQVMDTNLLGIITVSKLVIPHMIKNRCGKIVNMSSVSAYKGAIGQTIYSATKAGIIGFTRSLALELSRFNIQVNAIAPGFINTKMTEKLNHKVKDGYINAIPIKRFGECEEIANVTKFLCSDESSYIVGQTIVVDGGLSC